MKCLFDIDIPKLYITQLSLLCCPAYKTISNTSYVNSLLYCYEQLMACISQVKQMLVKVEGQKILQPQKVFPDRYCSEVVFYAEKTFLLWRSSNFCI